MATQRPEPAPCPMCGRVVARRKIAGGTATHGKLRVRHKCPHGKWCAQGDRKWGSHSNGNPPPRQSCCKEGYEARCRARIDARVASERAASAPALDVDLDDDLGPEPRDPFPRRGYP